MTNPASSERLKYALKRIRQTDVLLGAQLQALAERPARLGGSSCWISCNIGNNPFLMKDLVTLGGEQAQHFACDPKACRVLVDIRTGVMG
jgi:hypothetical protein